MKSGGVASRGFRIRNAHFTHLMDEFHGLRDRNGQKGKPAFVANSKPRYPVAVHLGIRGKDGDKGNDNDDDLS
jgi:hypothetical protein